MPEEMILPGTYVEVRAEGLITAGSVATGNIGVVGTADAGPKNEVVLLSSLAEAKEKFVDSMTGSENTPLMKALQLIFANGGRSVYAVRAGQDGKKSQLELKVTPADGGDNGEEAASQPGLLLQAKEAGAAGDSIKISVTQDDTKTPPTTVTIAKGQGKRNTETYTITSLKDLYRQIEDANAGNKPSLVEAIELSPALKEKLPDAIGETLMSGGKDGDPPDYGAALTALEQELVNIVVLAGITAQEAERKTELEGHLKQTAGLKRERIGIMDLGSDSDGAEIGADNGRLILVTPGLQIDGADSSGYAAAAVPYAFAIAWWGCSIRLASRPVQASPTNKPLVVEGLSKIFNHGQLKQLVGKRALVLEKRNGVRVVKGITTSSGAWKQITTRRIVDYAIYGVRSGCDPYIGKLNNVRVRGAMKATLDGFLTRMVESEALADYTLDVSATRADEIAGIAKVTMALKPTFSIDFIQVTMYLD